MFNLDQLQKHLQDPAVTDQVLIHYVQNPNGQVPSVLALSELKRRQEVRAAPQAQAQNMMQPTVADKTIAQNVQANIGPNYGQHGLGSIAPQQQAQQMLTQQAPPQDQGVASLPPTQQMAEGGLTALDTGDMYDEQSYATGGIVAFDDGGSVLSRMKFGFSSPDEIRAAQGQGSASPFMGSGMPSADVDPTTLLYQKKALYDQLKDPTANKADIQNKINEIDAKIKNPYGIVPPTEIVKPVPPKEEPKTIPTKVAAAAMDPYAGLMTKERSLKDLSSEYSGLLGEDEGAKRASARLAKLDASAAKQEEMAPWLAVIKAGLGMAAGKSPYGITNFAEGAQLGVSDYVTAKDNLSKLEEKRFILENELSKQARTEKVAGLKYGQDSIQHTQEMNKTVKLAQIHEQNENARNNLDNAVKMSAAASKGNWDKKDFSKRYDEILDSGLYKQAEKELLDSKGAPAKDSPTFKLWQDKMVKQLISQTESSTGSSMSGWGPVSITSQR
jgi:hypothetical protein